MKRVGKPETRSFVIKRDGTLLDRDSGTVIGRVYLDPLLGWMASNSGNEFIGHGGKRHAARRAWEDWRRTSQPEGGEQQ